MAREKEYREIVNNSDREYQEEFKGNLITLPPRGSIVMERRDAVDFLAQYIPYDREKTTGEKPLSWRPAKAGAKPSLTTRSLPVEEPKHINHVTGKAHATKESLDEELAGFKHLQLKED